MKLLVDRMYPAALADGLLAAGIRASAVASLKLAGASDAEVFAEAVARGFAVVTENVGDFTRIASEHSTVGGHHHGLLIALSSRFSRGPHGIEPLIVAIQAIAREQLDDRIIYLGRMRPQATP